MFLRRAEPHNHIANLPDPIRLRRMSARLEIPDLFDALAGEYVVAASNAFRKPRTVQERAKFVESNVRARRA